MTKFIFPIIIGLTAFSLAAMSAYCSITGLEKLFDGWQILIIASVIELGKIVSVSVLYRLWNEMRWWKALLIPMTLAVMLITSFGVYGFLSSSYEKKASEMRIGDSRIQLEEARKVSINERIERYNGTIKLKLDRVNSLMNLREQQENRVDSLYAKNMSRAAKDAQNSIREASIEVDNLNKEIEEINSLIQQESKQYASADSSIVMMKYENSKGEIGTLKYISSVSGASVDMVANFIMLLLIFVFDPLAVVLIVAFNISWNKSMLELVEDKKEKEDISILQEKESGHIENRNEDVDLSENESEFSYSQIPETIIAPNDVAVDVYRENEKGDFVKNVDKAESKTSLNQESESEKNEKKKLYLELLRILYKNGTLTANDHIMPYNSFISQIQSEGIEYTNEKIENFLSLCVMNGIIFLSNKLRYALKNYSEAVDILTRSLQ